MLRRDLGARVALRLEGEGVEDLLSVDRFGHELVQRVRGVDAQVARVLRGLVPTPHLDATEHLTVGRATRIECHIDHQVGVRSGGWALPPSVRNGAGRVVVLVEGAPWPAATVVVGLVGAVLDRREEIVHVAVRIVNGVRVVVVRPHQVPLGQMDLRGGVEERLRHAGRRLQVVPARLARHPHEVVLVENSGAVSHITHHRSAIDHVVGVHTEGQIGERGGSHRASFEEELGGRGQRQEEIGARCVRVQLVDQRVDTRRSCNLRCFHESDAMVLRKLREVGNVQRVTFCNSPAGRGVGHEDPLRFELEEPKHVHLPAGGADRRSGDAEVLVLHETHHDI